MLPKGFKVGATGTTSTPATPAKKPGMTGQAAKAVGGAIKSGAQGVAKGAVFAAKETASAAVGVKNVAANTVKSTPMAVKNAAVHPQAAARSVGKEASGFVKSMTVGLPETIKQQGVGKTAVKAGMLATGAAVPVVAAIGAAKAKPRPKPGSADGELPGRRV